jgi:hypothetical protein
LGDSVDHYRILKINENATRDEVRAAYLRLVQESHPDRFSADATSETSAGRESFKRVQAAYETLYDQERRAEYDRSQLVHQTRFMHAAHAPRVRRDVASPWMYRRTKRRSLVKRLFWVTVALIVFIVAVISLRTVLLLPGTSRTQRPRSLDEKETTPDSPIQRLAIDDARQIPTRVPPLDQSPTSITTLDELPEFETRRESPSSLRSASDDLLLSVDAPIVDMSGYYFRGDYDQTPPILRSAADPVVEATGHVETPIPTRPSLSPARPKRTKPRRNRFQGMNSYQPGGESVQIPTRPMAPLRPSRPYATSVIDALPQQPAYVWGTGPTAFSGTVDGPENGMTPSYGTRTPSTGLLPVPTLGPEIREAESPWDTPDGFLPRP